VLFDRNEYISELNDRLSTFPFAERKLKIGMEYGKLIRRFVHALPHNMHPENDQLQKTLFLLQIF
jgi:hypothetical protein